MTEKILFLIDLWFFHFGIAKSLQDLGVDYELYSIIDVNKKAKKFFDEQKLVDFKKTYFFDKVKIENKKPDMEYLKEFEKKYKINLWRVAYTDRAFYQYNNFHNFDENEILSLIEQQCRFFEKVLDEVNPNFLAIFLSITHYQFLLTEMCRVKGIKILMLVPAKLGKRILISENDTSADYISKKSLEKMPALSEKKLDEYYKMINPFRLVQETKERAFESKKMERYKAVLRYFFSNIDEDYGKRYSNYGRTKFFTFNEKIFRSVKRKNREKFLNNNLSKQSGEKPYIYFPLHYEPERILLISAPLHDNQLSIITNIAKSIPVGYNLVVKEHPFMKTIGWRPISFYKTIMKLPNVKLVHPSLKPEEIVKKSSLVITIGGTAGLEAAYFKKPCITFTDTIYSMISNIHKLDKIDNLSSLIRSCLDEKVETVNLGQFVEIINKNSFEFDIGKLSADFAFQFGLKGLLMDADLPLKKIENFLEKYKTVFEMVGNEHIKKINQHKSNMKI